MVKKINIGVLAAFQLRPITLFKINSKLGKALHRIRLNLENISALKSDRVLDKREAQQCRSYEILREKLVGSKSISKDREYKKIRYRHICCIRQHR